ncbi:MAG: hypothetical protein ACJAT4_002881 [Granulosicoccus sp.]|jgi:hypothetical protein
MNKILQLLPQRKEVCFIKITNSGIREYIVREIVK